MRLTSALLLTLAACTGTPADDKAEETGAGETGAGETGDDTADTAVESDLDQDGYTVADGDCDDTNGAVNPGAAETCNAVDDDCDSDVDEQATDTTAFYADADYDGYGDDATELFTCVAPAGYVPVSGDCNDADGDYNPAAAEEDCTDPNDYNCDGSVGYADVDGDGWPACTECDDNAAAVNPAAAELCNSVDDDCDGSADESDATGAPTWYADADLDGYGDPSTGAPACTAPAGQVADSADCDDTRAEDNPSAMERCDTRDNNCDGNVDEDTAEDAPTWYFDGDADGYGTSAVTAVSCEAPPSYVSSSGDCDDGDTAYNPAATESCDDPNDYNCDGSVAYADADADGFAACTECDDTDAAVNPDALESCNGTDDDCDGSTDEDDAIDVSTWYADADGDGYGAPALTYASCTAPTGYVADNTDCDDAQADDHPGGAERCDTRDNNCDGTVDEDTAVDAGTWYVDEDGDGYGDGGRGSMSCTAPAGTVDVAGDCDDGNAAISRDAIELCDYVDNDCDGVVDENDAADAPTWYFDSDGDKYGTAATSRTSCSIPPGYVADATDCDDTSSAYNPAATEVCDGTDNNCDGSADEDAAVDAATWYADTDGDTYGDPAVTTTACSAPADYVADDTDCDDTDPARYSSATDTPQDGVDQDCSGTDAPYSLSDLVEGDLVINEILQNPSMVSDSVGEWFEIYNASGGMVDLGGLYVYDLGTDSFTVTGELVLASGGYAVLGIQAGTSTNGGVIIDYDYNGMALANGADEIYLADSSAKSVVFDQVGWDGGAIFPDPTGYSMSLSPTALDATDNDDGNNWCEASSTFGSGDYGTPGSANDGC